MRREEILGKTPAERLAVTAFAGITLALALLMPGWRADDRAPPDGYAMSPDAFVRWEDAFAARNATGRMVQIGPLVRPPPGDVPVLARRFAFVPALELRAGRTYRLHLSAADGVHSAALDGREVLLVPGRVAVLAITPSRPGIMTLQCGEYCGIGHSRMTAAITVIP
ncbi:MAG: quinol oxidase [Magnetospirillum sp.]|nr:quinol oxidase [Magnetospirillum sp.]